MGPAGGPGFPGAPGAKVCALQVESGPPPITLTAPCTAPTSLLRSVPHPHPLLLSKEARKSQAVQLSAGRESEME